MTPRLKSVTVTDFRSIRGTVTVPLDSPVVLIHGQNGSGKTSLLSAIELGLTGKLRHWPESTRHSNPILCTRQQRRGGYRSRSTV